MHDTKDLHDLCETISREIEEANEKIRKAGGKLSAGDLDYIDKLTHTLKSLKTTMAMMEAEDEEGYSGYYPYMGNSRSDGMGGWNDNSYARGRGRNAGRDSMGRYSRDGYSRNYSRDGGLSEELRGLMQDAPNEQIRSEIQRLVEKIDRM